MEWVLEEDGRWKRVDARKDLDRLLLAARRLTAESAECARMGRELIDRIRKNLRILRAQRSLVRAQTRPQIM